MENVRNLNGNLIIKKVAKHNNKGKYAKAFKIKEKELRFQEMIK